MFIKQLKYRWRKTLGSKIFRVTMKKSHRHTLYNPGSRWEEVQRPAAMMPGERLKRNCPSPSLQSSENSTVEEVKKV